METVSLRAEDAAKLTGKPVDELQALLEGKEQNEASTIFADTVAQNFGALRKKAMGDKYNQGIKDKGTAIERELSGLFEKYGIADFDTAEQGISLLSEKLEQQEKPGTPDFSQLTPEQIAELPAVQALTGKLEKAREALQGKEQEFEQFRADLARKEVDAKSLSATVSIFTKDKAITGNASPEQAASVFLASIPSNRRGLDKDGQPIPLDENGQQLADDYGQAVSWDQYVKDNYAFGFHVADPNTTGSGANPGRSTSGSSAIKIRSVDEANKAIQAATEAGDHKRATEYRRALSEHLRKNT